MGFGGRTKCGETPAARRGGSKVCARCAAAGAPHGGARGAARACWPAWPARRPALLAMEERSPPATAAVATRPGAGAQPAGGVAQTPTSSSAGSKPARDVPPPAQSTRKVAAFARAHSSAVLKENEARVSRVRELVSRRRRRPRRRSSRVAPPSRTMRSALSRRVPRLRARVSTRRGCSGCRRCYARMQRCVPRLLLSKKCSARSRPRRPKQRTCSIARPTTRHARRDARLSRQDGARAHAPVQGNGCRGSAAALRVAKAERAARRRRPRHGRRAQDLAEGSAAQTTPRPARRA